MEERRKKLLGDFVMSSVVGCATFLAFICMTAVIGIVLMIFLSFLNNNN